MSKILNFFPDINFFLLILELFHPLEIGVYFYISKNFFLKVINSPIHIFTVF